MVTFQLHLGDEAVGQAFPRQPLCVEPRDTIRHVFQVLKEQRRGCVLICQDEQLVGIFTERDALQWMVDGGDLDQPIETVMRRPVTTLSGAAYVGTAIQKMSQAGFRRLPIVDESNKPTGVLTSKTILHYLVQHFPTIVYTLPPEPHHRMQDREGA
ncbi:MAG: CBS domain-containing protein [Planctomycetales bacterium]|nr:CBS domain-containing protein [Planctomycetales bacterium]